MKPRGAYHPANGVKYDDGAIPIARPDLAIAQIEKRIRTGFLTRDEVHEELALVERLRLNVRRGRKA